MKTRIFIIPRIRFLARVTLGCSSGKFSRFVEFNMKGFSSDVSDFFVVVKTWTSSE